MTPIQVLNLVLVGLEKGAPLVMKIIEKYKDNSEVTYEEVMESIANEPPAYKKNGEPDVDFPIEPDED